MMYSQKKPKAILYAILLSIAIVLACITAACVPAKAAAPLVESNLKSLDTQENDNSENSQNTSEPAGDEDTEEIITKMKISEMKPYYLFYEKKYYGDYLYYFGKHTSRMFINYVFLKSDNSLIGYYSHDTDLSLPIELSETKLKEIALQYIKEIWGYEDVSDISSVIREGSIPSQEEYFYEFTGKSSSDERVIYINLNGKGILSVAESYPKMDLSGGVTMDEAYDIALAEIKSEAHIIDADNLKIIHKSIKNDNKLYPVYYFNIHYSAKNPTAKEFDYSCQINVNSSNGKCHTIAVRPYVYNNPELILPEDASIIARKEIAETYYGSPDLWSNLRQRVLYIDTFEGKVEYYFDFDYYPEGDASREIVRSYGISMSATGEIWEIHPYSPSEE